MTVYSYNIKLTPANPHVVRPLNWYSYEIYRYAFHDIQENVRRGCKFNKLAFRAAKIYALSTESIVLRPRGKRYDAAKRAALPTDCTVTERREDKTISALVVTSNVFIVSLSSLRFLQSRGRFYRD